jgi:TonB-dependent receptor
MNSLAFATEEITAGYAEAQIKIKRLRILGGVRLEQTEPEGKAPLKIAQLPALNNTADANLSVAENIERAKRVFTGWGIQHSRYRNVFPGLHFVYDLGGGLQARASYNVSITRPGLGNVIPNYTVNDTSRTITRGNVDLKPYTAENYELGLEYYFEPVGRLSASVFDKEITNYFRNFNTVIAAGADNGYDGNYEGYTLTTARNVGTARIRGLELDYWQQYNFLPGFLKGFGTHAHADEL